jgi:hypothetical protein
MLSGKHGATMLLTIRVPDNLLKEVKEPLEIAELEIVALDAVLDFLHLLATGGGPSKGLENA